MQSLGVVNDPFVDWLIHLENERRSSAQVDPDKAARESELHKKTVLTRILAVGLRDYFDLELARAQGAVNQEKAFRAQAAAPGSPKAQEAWSMAHNAWGRAYVYRIPLAAVIDQRLNQLRKSARDLDQQLTLLESLHVDVHKYFQARLCLTECIAYEEGSAAARNERTRTMREIEELQKKGLLPAEIKAIAARLQGLPPPVRQFFQKRLDLLDRDWSQQGSFFWLQRQLEQQ